MICVNKVIHQASVPMMEVGTRRRDLEKFPWGWIIYAHLSEAQRRIHRETMVNDDEFIRKYRRWRASYEKEGYAVDREELISSLRRIAAPVFNTRGALVGCLGIGGNPHSLPDGLLKEAAMRTLKHARRLSAVLGYREKSREKNTNEESGQ
ncbi:MAG: hypothetical protein GF344_02505 [Chitinivibrionales bacterium]|nr:hypothetical protein [Chitinivibrionales bacterium]MBD3355958.1 hypothetical protein [Chitinivibrionales bacterium]